MRTESNSELKIGLLGRMRSGKDAVAARLTDNHGFKRFAFGDALKFYANSIFGRNAAGAKPRELYQQFGQLCRGIDPDVWVRNCFALIAMQPQHPRVVISDVRQPNEITELRRRGYVLVRVTAPEELRIARMQAAGDDWQPVQLEHETEQHIDGATVDFEIVNDGTLAELHAKVDAVVTQLTTSHV